MHLRLVDTRLFPLLATLALSLVSVVQARESDRQQPMHVDADSVDALFSDNGNFTLNGNVSIRQGTLEIGSHTATVTRKDGEISRVILDGAPASMRQQNDDNTRMNALAKRIEYDVANEVIVLSGDVAIDHGADIMRGDRIVYDLRHGKLNARGQNGDGNSRIQMVIQPRTKPSQPPQSGDETP